MRKVGEGGWKEEEKMGFWGVGARCGRRRKSGGGGGRKEGRKEEELLLVHCCCCCARPPPPKKNDCCRLQCRPTVKTPKRAYIPEMGLAPESGFTLYPSFLSSLFFAPPGCPACTLAGYKRLCGSLQHFFYSGKKEDMSVRRQCAPSPPNGGRELEGKSKVMPNHLLVQQMR